MSETRVLTIAKAIRLLPALLLLAAGFAGACPIPVYQYALEHWESDAYRIDVSLGADPSAEQYQALKLLRQAAEGSMTGNLVLRLGETVLDNGNAGQAVLEVRYPEISGIQRVIWSGELSLENVRALLASPLRTRLGDALLRRTSAVWLLLESGDRAADNEAEKLLKQQLSLLEKELLVPETAEWGGQDVAIDANVNFAVMRVGRDDPAERMLVNMLLASEADLAEEFAGAPMVFPVYGRGLILYALVGRGINAWTIGEAARFLTGPCSCQIKAANPGTDLLTDIDWQNNIKPMTPAAVGTTVGTGTFIRRLDEAGAED